RLPPLLVIHLKRFCFTQVSRRKLHHLVDFPLRGLQFGDFVARKPVRGDDGFLYDLYAVVNHVGALGGGHYFAYVLSDHDGKWKCFNDHQCKDIDEKEVVSSMAYILFYRR
uniref:ubiquitinyl hydrolase 1 n=1 Tax=Phytophthora ramorum TaxID=164328 RepID=H3G7H7_PHYRM